jgi:hypothetical protein
MREPSLYGMIPSHLQTMPRGIVIMRYALIFAAFSLLVLGTARAEADERPIQERMSDAEFQAAGLYKLSEQELAWLNAFLAGENAATEQAEAATIPEASEAVADRASEPPEDVGFESRERSSRQPFTAQIDGEFSGWSGDTEFRLSNGQVWKQTQGGRFYFPGEPPVNVEFTPGFLGSWYMSVEGYNRRVRVERVR